MRFIIAGWLMLASFNVLAQDRLPPGVRGPDSAMATRSVSKYLQLERVMQEAIRDHNAAEVNACWSKTLKCTPPTILTPSRWMHG